MYIIDIRFPDPVPTPTDLANADSRAFSRSQILFGIGDEGGKSIYIQAHLLKMALGWGDLPDSLTITAKLINFIYKLFAIFA